MVSEDQCMSTFTNDLFVFYGGGLIIFLEVYGLRRGDTMIEVVKLEQLLSCIFSV